MFRFKCCTVCEPRPSTSALSDNQIRNLLGLPSIWESGLVQPSKRTRLCRLLMGDGLAISPHTQGHGDFILDHERIMWRNIKLCWY